MTNKAELIEELKPCPFCGGEAVIREIKAHTHALATFMPDHPGSCVIECPKCDNGIIHDTKADVIKLWNTRIQPPSTVDGELIESANKFYLKRQPLGKLERGAELISAKFLIAKLVEALTHPSQGTEVEPFSSKCDSCVHLSGESASMDYPYPVTFCSKGHWEGGAEADTEHGYCDVWDSCSDFKHSTPTVPQDAAELVDITRDLNCVLERLKSGARLERNCFVQIKINRDVKAVEDALAYITRSNAQESELMISIPTLLHEIDWLEEHNINAIKSLATQAVPVKGDK